ncbi:uncharacterized protein LOC126320421 isoform X2 [Schistocerca gregaria]|uniref:uncharacterized protein LOC126320421 isoform X2 n=1 Tax=Schistocerca gregaria TaxID=7010 RepID=UPI00211DBD9F|nr:uncharacterized protein LOC126320421 isoform X2 [Schistocerca gregaria]
MALFDDCPSTGSFSLFPETYPDANDVAVESQQPLRIYADGIYDLFHYGHIRLVKRIKAMFPNCFLIAGVCSDADTNLLKGPTLMNELERAEQVLACRYVDQVIVRCPWVITQEFMQKHEIDLVVHGKDDSYDEHGNDVYAYVKSIGKFFSLMRTKSISTSDIIARVLKQNKLYLERSIKRGLSHSDLGISYDTWHITRSYDC